jgi:hypothetical protein
MIGFFGMIVVFLGLNCVLSYWVSWDMQHKETRPGFGTQIRNDIAVSLQSITAKPRRALMKKSVARGFSEIAAR